MKNTEALETVLKALCKRANEILAHKELSAEDKKELPRIIKKMFSVNNQIHKTNKKKIKELEIRISIYEINNNITR